MWSHRSERAAPSKYRLALRPCLDSLTAEETADLLAEIEELGLPDFFAFLLANRLDQIWREYLAPLDLPEAFATHLGALNDRALYLAAQNIKEKVHMRTLHRLLEEAEIPYFIFKGANLRYTLYPIPTLRSSCDIDLFVPEALRYDAIQCLVSDGFELHIDPRNTSHEVSLVKDGIHIDLHWQLMRPGRTRIDLSDYLFANREAFCDGFQGLNHRASLLVMLIHPAFTKHLASPSSMLIHMVDLDRLLQIALEEWGPLEGGLEEGHPKAGGSEGWDPFREMLDRSGTRTAAWSSLRVLSRYGGPEAAAQLARQIQPGRLHRRYLQYWLDHDLIRRWFHRRPVIRALFSLALQDSLADAARAVVGKLASPSMEDANDAAVAAETPARRPHDR